MFEYCQCHFIWWNEQNLPNSRIKRIEEKKFIETSELTEKKREMVKYAAARKRQKCKGIKGRKEWARSLEWAAAAATVATAATTHGNEQMKLSRIHYLNYFSLFVFVLQDRASSNGKCRCTLFIEEENKFGISGKNPSNKFFRWFFRSLSSAWDFTSPCALHLY